jgi:hypothetical protein
MGHGPESLHEDILHLKRTLVRTVTVQWTSIRLWPLDWSNMHCGRDWPGWPLYTICRPCMIGSAGFWQGSVGIGPH